MVVCAYPLYRRAGPGPDIVEYTIDSLILAIQLPVCILSGFGMPIVLVASVLLWAFTLAPLFCPRTRQWIGRAYLTLIPIWILYALGWAWAHLGAVH